MAGNIIIIIGGVDKGQDFQKLADFIKQTPRVKAVTVIGLVTDKILGFLQGFKGKIFSGAKNMEEIFQQVNSISDKGDTVLLSPASSSFDMFKNATDRAEQFIKAVNSING